MYIMLCHDRNLEKNNLSGSVPVKLTEKSNNGSLKLRSAFLCSIIILAMFSATHQKVVDTDIVTIQCGSKSKSMCIGFMQKEEEKCCSSNNSINCWDYYSLSNHGSSLLGR